MVLKSVFSESLLVLQKEISGNDESDILLTNDSFSAPITKGVYYYSYGVWWMDEKEENLSHGDAFYVFVIEVK